MAPSVSASGGGSGEAWTKTNGPHVSSAAARRPSAARSRLVRVGARRRAQRAVEAVGPRVVVALQRRAAPGARHDLRAAVAADVDERAQLAVAIAHDDDRHVARAAGEVRAGLGDEAEVPGVVPGRREERARARRRAPRGRCTSGRAASPSRRHRGAGHRVAGHEQVAARRAPARAPGPRRGSAPRCPAARPRRRPRAGSAGESGSRPGSASGRAPRRCRICGSTWATSGTTDSSARV